MDVRGRDQPLRAWLDHLRVERGLSENTLVAYRQEQVRHKHLTTAVQANHRAVDLAEERYTKGLSDFLSVLESQRALYVTEDAMVQSESQAVDNLIALYKALGGGWDVGATAVVALGNGVGAMAGIAVTSGSLAGGMCTKPASRIMATANSNVTNAEAARRNT